MRRGTAYPDRPTMPPPADLTEAACAGNPMFTADYLDRITVARLLVACSRCPVLQLCIADRDRFRQADPYAWAQVSGVWGAQAWSKGRPYVGSGARPRRAATA